MPAALTPEDIDAILTIIEEHTLGLVFDATGSRSGMSPAMFHDLVRKGIITEAPKIDSSRGAWAYGYLMEVLGSEDVTKMSMPALLDRARELRLSEPERLALQHIQEKAGTNITVLGERLKADVQRDINDINQRFATSQALQAVRDVAAESSRRRMSRNETVTRMREAVGAGERTRDWHRVVHTELQDARTQGQATAVINRKGLHVNSDGIDSLVFRRASSDACLECKKLYSGRDGVTPKLFVLRELVGNGTNVGRKRSEWRPVVGSTHPWCHCSGVTRMPREEILEDELARELGRKPELHEIMREMTRVRFGKKGELSYV